MADPRSFTEQSKRDWWRDGHGSVEELNLGCLQRIANATEAMATYHAQLIRERDKYERWYRNEAAKVEAIARSNRALKGVITKLKRQVADDAEGADRG